MSITPSSILSLILAVRYLPQRFTDKAPENPPLDWFGLLLLTIFITFILIALSQGQREGWTENITLTRFFISIAAFIGFILWELTTKHPLLGLTLFQLEGFASASIVTFIFATGLYASLLTAPLFLQIVQGLDATNAGLVLLPGGLLIACLFPFTGKLADKLSPRYLIMIGLLLFALSSYLAASADYFTSMSTFTIWILYSRLCLALIFPSINLSSLAAVEQSRVAQAAGALNFIRKIGGAFGVNLFIVYIEQRTSVHARTLFDSQHSGNGETWQVLSTLSHYMTELGVSTQQQLYASFWYWGKEISLQALSISFQDVFYLTAMIFLLSLIPCLFLKKNKEIQLEMKAMDVVKALDMTVGNRQYQHHAIHHSDRGLQYCSKVYQTKLNESDITINDRWL